MAHSRFASREGTAVGTPLDDDLKELPLGKGVVVREGSDVAIFALGKSASASLEAAEDTS